MALSVARRPCCPACNACTHPKQRLERFIAQHLALVLGIQQIVLLEDVKEARWKAWEKLMEGVRWMTEPAGEM